MWTRISHLQAVHAAPSNSSKALSGPAISSQPVSEPLSSNPLETLAPISTCRRSTAVIPRVALASLPLLCAVGCLPVSLEYHDDPTALDLDSDGWTLATGDCNDHDAQVHPTQLEACDGIDNNCDKAIDEGLAQQAWYPDRDGDGVGFDGAPELSCAVPQGYVQSVGDCNDDDASVYPSAAELCDQRDNDCNGLVDDGLAVTTFFRDLDLDGFGAGDHVQGCAPPSGFADGHGDCNDADASIHPGADDLAGDSIDQDCGGFDGPQPHVGLSPTSAPSMQAALNAARDGETVWVGPGRYLEAGLSFRGRAITLEATCGPISSIVDAAGQGSVMLLTSSEGPGTVVRGFTLTGGKADHGAGVLMQGVSARLEDLIIEGNEATGDGGGVYAESSTAVLSGCSIQGNIARRGGGLFVSGSSPNIDACAFSANQAGWGGGLYAYQASLSVTSSTFSINQALVAGGAMLAWESNLNLQKDELTENAARAGGGLAFWSTTGELNGSSLSGNFAAFGGGALLMDSAPVLTDSRFTENRARFLGGGLFVSGSSSSASMVRLLIEDNRAFGVQDSLGAGGGVFFQQGATASMAGCRIVGNSAAGYGGGVAINSSSPVIDNCMLLDNSAEVLGGGMLVAGESTPRVTGSILAYNDHFNLYLQAYVGGVPHPTVAYSDLYAPESGMNHNMSGLDASNLTVDPRFEAYDETGMPVDYHLAVDSYLINAGNPAVNDVDGSRSDMGSYGGPTGGHWDVDGDGLYDYFWPGKIQNAPAGINAAVWDCDDMDAGVGACG